MGSKIDRDTVMRLVRQHFAPALQKQVTVERWKDGIEVEYTTAAIELFAQAAFDLGREDAMHEMDAAGFRQVS